MNFGMFTDFHVREGMTQAEAFEEAGGGGRLSGVVENETLGTAES